MGALPLFGPLPREFCGQYKVQSRIVKAPVSEKIRKKDTVLMSLRVTELLNFKTHKPWFKEGVKKSLGRMQGSQDTVAEERICRTVNKAITCIGKLQGAVTVQFENN